jgi:diketogulonate reductase-like aldo/keto reductase
MEYHPYLLTQLDPVIAMHEKYGILTQAYGPLTPILRHPTGGPLKPVLEKIAARITKDTGMSCDSAGVLLLWTIQKGVSAVTTSANEGRIKAMASTEQLPDLTKEDMDEIEQMGRKIHFRHYVSDAAKPWFGSD